MTECPDLLGKEQSWIGLCLIDGLPLMSKVCWITTPIGMSSRWGILVSTVLLKGIKKDRTFSFRYTLERIWIRSSVVADWWFPRSYWLATSSSRVASSRSGPRGYLYPFLSMFRIVFQLGRCCQRLVRASKDLNSEPGLSMVLFNF